MSEEQVAFPVVTVNGIDITHACIVDMATQSITLPENLPGGSEVYVNGEPLIITAVELEAKGKHLQLTKRQRILKASKLQYAIRSSLAGVNKL